MEKELENMEDKIKDAVNAIDVDQSDFNTEYKKGKLRENWTNSF